MGEEKKKSSRQEQDVELEGDEAPNPFGTYILSENLMDKLKLLDYDDGFCKGMSMNPIGRHFFAIPSNPNEQLWYFGCLVSWLLKLCGSKFPAPDQYDDPNGIVTNIMLELRKQGLPTDFHQSKIKSGSGPEVCQILNNVAQMALKAVRWKWEKPVHDNNELPEAIEDDGAVEVTANDVEEEIEEEDFEQDDAFIDVDMGATLHNNVDASSVQVMQSSTTSAEWKIELERVLPQLKVHIRADAKDWRNHLSEMTENKKEIDSAMERTAKHLGKLHSEVARVIEKIESRERYINTQLDRLIVEYRQSQDELASVSDKYKASSGTVTELSQSLAQLTEELELVKTQMDERGNSMTDASPLVKIKQALNKVKAEIAEMDLRLGVVSHILLAANSMDKSEMLNTMNAAVVLDDGDDGAF